MTATSCLRHFDEGREWSAVVCHAAVLSQSVKLLCNGRAFGAYGIVIRTEPDISIG